jgi:histidyl-tRNA synthetase
LNLPEEKIDAYFVAIDKELSHKVYELALLFRRKGLSIEIDYASRSVKAQMREANKLNAKFVVFIGGEEFENDKVRIKNMSTGDEQTVPITNVEEITKMISGQ